MILDTATSPSTQVIVLIVAGIAVSIFSSLGGYALARNRKMYRDDAQMRQDVREMKDLLVGAEASDLEKKAGVKPPPGMAEVLNVLATAVAASGLTMGAEDGPFVRENGPSMTEVRTRLTTIEKAIKILKGDTT